MFPYQLKIGGITYNVRRCPRRDMYDGDLLGDVKYSEGDIRVAEWICEEKQLQTLWHEIVHAFFVEADVEPVLGEEGPRKEEIIQHLSKVIQRFVQDNELNWEKANWKKP